MKTNNSRSAKKIERSLHEKFTALWIMGEWFQCEQELLKYINSYKE
ncbi:GIY-YIG nuclease family protein [Euhalothece natronophila]